MAWHEVRGNEQKSDWVRHLHEGVGVEGLLWPMEWCESHSINDMCPVSPPRV